MGELDAAGKAAIGERTIKDLVESGGDLPDMKTGGSHQ